MSMYRQMWLAITLSTLLALLGGLLASTLTARSYLAEQLSQKNTDNVTSLALALSQQNANAVMVELTVAALFDSGHYELIRVVDPLGKLIVERATPANARTAPDWFVRALHLDTTPGQAQISNGWNQLGTLTLISNSRFAYQALWESALKLALALALSGLAGGFMAAMVLRRLRDPLQRVVSQADAICERRFVVIDVPDVPELRQLALAMNSTVTRLKSMFDEEAQRLEALRVAANYDPLTGLANRTFFLVQLLDLLDTEEATGSTLLLVRMANFARLTQRLGAPAVDEKVQTFAAVLSQHATRVKADAARIGEPDFALLLPVQAEAREVASKLLAALIEACAPLTGSGPTAYIGTAKLQPGQDLADLMAQASGALIAAEATRGDTIRQAADQHPASGEEDTAQLIRLAIEAGQLRLLSLPVLDLEGKLTHRECALEVMLSGTSDWRPTRHFLQITEARQLTPLLDLAAIQLAFETLGDDPGLPALAVRLSALTFTAENFRQRLLDQLRKTPSLTGRLWLEVPEAAAIENLDSFRTFVAEVRQAGSRAGLTHFGDHVSPADLLHDLGLDFVKVDSSFIRGLQFSAANQIFLKGLASAAHKMGMQVYARDVIDRAELAALEGAGFDGASGPAVEEPR